MIVPFEVPELVAKIQIDGVLQAEITNIIMMGISRKFQRKKNMPESLNESKFFVGSGLKCWT